MRVKFRNGPPDGCRGIIVFLWVFTVISWVINFIKLLSCDFEASYKEEVIHSIGVFIPPASLITCWL